MPSVRIPKNNTDGIFFITCTIQHWYSIFDRHQRWEMLAASLQYCQKYKGLKIFAYVFMLNHLHLLARAPDMIRVLCDFKKFTSRELIKNILATEPAVAALFPQENGKYKLWQETNMPKVIEDTDIFYQKLNYIHENPVRKQYVLLPEHWYWSSANPHQPIIIADPEDFFAEK